MINYFFVTIFVLNCMINSSFEIRSYDDPCFSRFINYNDSCSIEVLTRINNELDHLSPTDIKHFLRTYHNSCKYNVEYSEWFNELLFEILDNYPDELLSQMYSDTLIDGESIIVEFGQPTHDNINLSKSILKVQEVDIDEGFKKRIITSLHKHR